MGAKVELESPRRQQGLTLIQLRERYGLTLRQRDLEKARIVTKDLHDHWEPRRIINDAVLTRAEALHAMGGYRDLRFAEIPFSLTPKAILQSPDLEVLPVPAFPMQTAREIAEGAKQDSSPFKKIYGKELLKRMARSEVAVDRSGHYVFMDGPKGTDTLLSKELGINEMDPKDVSLDKVRAAIAEKGYSSLERRLGESGVGSAVIDIATVEEVVLYNKLHPDTPFYGLTSTQLPGTEEYITVTPNGYGKASSSDTGIPFRLAIRLGPLKSEYLNPSVKLFETTKSSRQKSEVVEIFDSATTQDQTNIAALLRDSGSVVNPLVRRRATLRLEELASKS